MITPIPIARSGTIASGSIGWPHIASGAIQSGDIANAAVVSGSYASGQIASGHLASGLIAGLLSGGFVLGSGNVGSGIIASGAVDGFFGNTRRIASGTLGVWDFGSGAIVFGAMGSGAVTSGSVASGQLGSFHHASGQLTGFELGSGAIVSGRIASGQVGNFHIASGQVQGLAGAGVWNIASGSFTGFELGSGSVVSGRIASGQIGTFALSSGIIQSGFWVASGSIFGQAGPNQFCIASGTITTNDLGSGAIVSGLLASGQIGRFHHASGQLAGFELGSGSIVSGRVASGQIGFGHLANASVQSGTLASGIVFQFFLASGAVNSGHINTTAGTPGTTTFLRGDFTWATVTATIGSGSVGSGAVASGAVQGFFGTTPNIASGTVGFWDFGSGAVTAGNIGSGAVQSGNVASGQIGFGHLANASVKSGAVASGQLATYHFASGAAVSISQYVASIISGTAWTALTQETVSGLRAVAMSQSGNIQVAMASVSGRMMAIGIVAENVLSGIQCNVYSVGSFQATSGMADYSGYLGQQLFVGRSGQVVSQSGSFNSGGLLSGDIWQPIGYAMNSGMAMLELASMLPAVPGLINSGNVASGQLSTYHLASGVAATASQFVAPIYSGTNWTMLTQETISGTRAVCISQSGNLLMAMAATSGRMPAVGVVWDNVLSGLQANVYTQGLYQFTSGMANFSGFLGRPVWVDRSGSIVALSGSWNSGGYASGDVGQKMGTIANSGAVLFHLNTTVWSGGPLGEATGGIL